MKLTKLEKKLFCENSRFKLKNFQYDEIFKDFKNANILLCGAAGSIGKAFSLRLKEFEISRVYFLDKDENGLADLSRDINLVYGQNIYREYICRDLNDFNLNNFFKQNKITHYFNFAALKHVRSEENKYSIHNLIQTNCLGPFKIGNLSHPKIKIRKIFFISTDKVAYPTSLMGCSKKIMENKLYYMKKKYKKIFISSVRFANVAFSNGSILKNIFDKANEGKFFGVPSNIKRYFITHEEAVDLCLLANLKSSDGYITLPKYKIIGKQKNLKFLTIKILNLLKKKFIIVKKYNNLKKSYQQVVFHKIKIIGQKNKEYFFERNEYKKNFDNDNRLLKIKMYPNNRLKNFDTIFVKQKSIFDYKRTFKKIYSTYKFTYKGFMLKNII